MSTLLETTRPQFPALARCHQGQPVAYFDGPGGTQVPVSVVEAMADYLYHHNANTHWHYPTSVETDAVITDARTTLATFLNASGPHEVCFGQNMSTLTFHVARALARTFAPGDEVVDTDLDHHANIDPWRHAARDHGLVVRHAPLDATRTRVDLDALAGLLGPRTRLVAVGAASNAIGTITDVREIAARAHAVNALVFVDAVHYAPHVLVDVQALECDLLACSAYKFYGPHIGVLWGRHAVLEGLDLPKLQPSPAHAPESVETGTQSHEAMAGAAAAVRFLAGTDAGGFVSREALQARLAAFHHRGQTLITRLWEGLQALAHVRCVGLPPDAPRTPTVAFTVAGVPSDEVSRRLGGQGLFVSSGDFYATTLVERLGLAAEGLVRVGCACYTSDEEVERLLDALARMA